MADESNQIAEWLSRLADGRAAVVRACESLAAIAGDVPTRLGDDVTGMQALRKTFGLPFLGADADAIEKAASAALSDLSAAHRVADGALVRLLQGVEAQLGHLARSGRDGMFSPYGYDVDRYAVVRHDELGSVMVLLTRDVPVALKDLLSPSDLYLHGVEAAIVIGPHRGGGVTGRPEPAHSWLPASMVAEWTRTWRQRQIADRVAERQRQEDEIASRRREHQRWLEAQETPAERQARRLQEMEKKLAALHGAGAPEG